MIVPLQSDGTWTVIDCDNIETDPAHEWGQCDEEATAYIQANYPPIAHDYTKYFATFEQ